MFTSIEKEILSKLLEDVSEDLCNNSCNDFPILVTEENIDGLKLFINDLDEDLLDQVKLGKKVYFTDFMLIDYLRDKITA